MAGYVRKDTANNIADGNVINASDFDNEFDGVQDAFNSSTGHVHDGTTGNGGPISSLGPTQDVVVSATAVTPKTNNIVDVGSAALKFKNLHLAGTASVGGTLAVTGVATLTAQPILSSLTASQAVFTNGTKGLVSNAITGTGTVVMSTSPTLVTPALGTPSALVGTNITGTAAGLTAGNVTTNANLTGAVTSIGNATSLGSFTSAALLGALTDETGTGSAVFATSPTLVTPNLGTPSALVGTNITGTATSFTASNVTTNANLTGGVTSIGNAATVVTNANLTGAVTSVGNATSLGSFTSLQLSTALTNETGTGSAVFATSPTLVTPALGTPSALVGTNITGTASGLSIGGNAANVTGTVAIANGGTGQTTRQAAMDALAGAVISGQYLRGNGTDVVMSAIQAADVPTLNQNTTGTAANVTGTVAVANGGTGATTLAANNVILGNNGSAVQLVAPGTTGNVLTSNGTTWTSAAAGGGFATGTLMLFAQTAAPTGWTKSTTHNDKALRVVSGTAASGGTSAFTTVFTNQTPTITTSGLSAAATTLSTAQIASHTHTVNTRNVGCGSPGANFQVSQSDAAPLTSNATGGGGSHTHSISGSATSSAITLAVQYVDVIIASKN